MVGCTALPVDVEGTFDRASDGTLVVGVSDNDPWTALETDLITSFADTIGAEIDWREGPESVLAERIRDGEIDVFIGGLNSSSPWASHMALTHPYQDDMVMGVRLGENKLLVNLERHLFRESADE